MPSTAVAVSRRVLWVNIIGRLVTRFILPLVGFLFFLGFTLGFEFMLAAWALLFVISVSMLVMIRLGFK